MEGSHYVIRNAGFNSNIPAGETISFGFNGQGGSKEQEPQNCKLFAYDAQKTAYHTVSFDLNYDSAADAPKAQNIKDNEYAVLPEKPVRENYIFLGWFTNKEFSQYFDFGNMPVTSEMTLFARWVNIVDNTDTDGDGIVDSLEELFGTDKTKADTDGDGLSDYAEIDSLETDPLKQDTDDNGVKDGEEDNDSDGLNNLSEVKFETNPNVVDTDKDDLNDSEEINIYGTDPLQQDTDGDGVSDGKEIQLKTDPLTLQESFHVNAAAEGEGAVKASVTVELSGEQVETLCVGQVENDALFPENIPGYIGEAYDFSVDGSFDTATISFAFDSGLLENKDFAPTIYYFNEKDQQLEPLQTTINGSTASAKVEHFSTYILMNRKVYEKSFSWTDIWDTNSYTGVEVVFVIDDSGSMSSNDRDYQRLTVAQTLIDHLPKNSKAGVVRFASSTSVLTKNLTDDREVVKSYLTKTYFGSNGGTYMYRAINAAMPLFGSDDDKVLKMMVVLSDGATSDSSSHAATVKEADNKGIKVYTIGLGNGSSFYFEYYMKPLAVNTGGEFYFASDADKLAKIYDTISQKIDIQTDSDSDGIPDYYEEHMVLFNGVTLKLDKNNPDTDGDGILDGKEVELKYEYNADKTKVIVTGKIKSDPTKKDTDGDGLYDNEARIVNGKKAAPKDTEPLKPNGPDGIWESHVNQQKNGKNPTKYGNSPGLDISVDPEISNLLVELALKFRDPVNENGEFIRKAALIVKEFCKGEAAAKAGAYLLNFIYDDNYVAYHSQPDTWQRTFGYNDFYDDVFRIGSYMHYDTLEFPANGTEYALWMWKGDYWNLHSGAEVGLYKNPKIISGAKHYESIDFELPMSLSLYNYYSAANIENIFSWSPEVNQWWVTGFNPELKNPNPDVMVSVGSIDFSGREELFRSMKNAVNDVDNVKDYLMFDEDGHTLWIIWYKGVML